MVSVINSSIREMPALDAAPVPYECARGLASEFAARAAQHDRETYYRQTLQPAKLAGYQAYLRERSLKSDVGVIWRTIGSLLPGRSATRSTTEHGPDLPDGPV